MKYRECEFIEFLLPTRQHHTLCKIMLKQYKLHFINEIFPLKHLNIDLADVLFVAC